MKEKKLLLELSESPLAYYWLAWIQNKQGESYTQSLEKANQLSPLLVFPFRSETIKVLQWASQKSVSWKPRYYLALVLKEKSQVEASRKIFTELGNTPDFAPFYAARAALSTNDSVQAELDLKKAIELDGNEWRYHKLLATHYLTLNKNTASLAVVEPYYKAHPQNYVMGMLYAKTLLLNERYRECDQLLSTLTIIPFEGATEGRELYREAKLALALNEMQSKNYKKALQFISQSKLFPENLGVGKPYEEDIDLRLEEWMSYLCYLQMKKKGEAEKSLQKIIQFKPQIDNTVSNFLPANHLVTAWAMKVKGQSQEAVEWLNEQIKKHPENKILLWAKNVLTDRKSALTNEADPTTRVLLKLMNTEELQKL